MRRSFALDGGLPHYFLPFAAALIALASLKGPVQAQESTTFTIAAADGYGVSECLTSGQSCGQVVADAWCEAHGFSKAMASGMADDLTASIGPASLRSGKDDVVIRCAD